MNIIKSICVAFSMYSKIPMPRVEWNEKNMKYAMCFFPLVGAVIGGLMLLVRFLCGRFGFNTSVYAVVMTALPVLVSGGIHTDGFIDTVDALSSYGDKEKKLEILKDPHTGAFAIIGAVMYYLLFFGFMTEIWDIKATIAVSVGFVLSRSLSGLAIGIFKCAKNSGLLYTFKSAAHKKTIVTVMILYIALCVAMLFPALDIVPCIIIALATYITQLSYKFRVFIVFFNCNSVKAFVKTVKISAVPYQYFSL